MVDIPGNATTSRSIAVGGTTSDTLELASDTDWFRIALVAGQQISVLVQGLTLADPIVRIRNAAGTVIFQNDDWGDGLDSYVGFQVPTTGTYFIDVGSAPNIQTGTYQLSVSPYTSPPLGTIDDIARQLTHGYWNGDVHHFDVSASRSLTVNLTGLEPAGLAVARQALAIWTDIIGVAFPEVLTAGQIVFGQADEGTGAFSTAEWDNGITSAATVNVAPSRLSLHTYLHEIAHALGLGHAGDYNGGTAFSRYPYEAMFLNDGAAVSIMSYFDNGENSYYAGLGFTNSTIVTPQLADLIAMGNLYGLSATTRTGDTTYGFNNTSGRDIFDAAVKPAVSYTVFDSGGTDTLDYSGFGQNQLINLTAETFSNIGVGRGNVSIARGVVIENAIGGSGADTLIGNGAANTLSGRGGSDVLTGGDGNDTFRDTLANLSGDTIADFDRGDRIVLTDAALGLGMGLSGSQLTYGSASLMLSNLHNASIAVGAAPEGGVQIFFGGPPIIVSAGASVPAFVGAASAESSLEKIGVVSPELPEGIAEYSSLLSATQIFDPLILRTGGDLFGVS
jgi:serralysin